MQYAYLLGPSFRLVLIPALPQRAGSALMLSRPGCLVLRRGGLPVLRRSPTQALTGLNVE